MTKYEFINKFAQLNKSGLFTREALSGILNKELNIDCYVKLDKNGNRPLILFIDNNPVLNQLPDESAYDFYERVCLWVKTKQIMVLNDVLHQNLAGIFSHSQDGAAAHPKLIIKCQNLYKEVILVIY